MNAVNQIWKSTAMRIAAGSPAPSSINPIASTARARNQTRPIRLMLISPTAARGLPVASALDEPGEGDAGPGEERQIGGDEDRQRENQRHQIDLTEGAMRHGVARCLQSVRRQGDLSGETTGRRRRGSPRGDANATSN